MPSWGGVSRYAATPLIVALFPGHIDITRFLPWSTIATGNHLDRAKKNSEYCSDDWRSGISGPLRGELPRVHIFMNDGPNPFT